MNREITPFHRLLFVIPTVICLIVVIVCHQPILVFMAKWLDVGEPPRAADFVMVLPGGPENRPFVASAMLRAGLVTGVLTSETETGPSTDAGIAAPEDLLFRRTLRLRGVRDDQIHVLPGHSNSTWTDALALAKFMHEHPQATVAIVTDAYHTRRSRWVFQKVLRDELRRVFFVSARSDRITDDTWWMSERGLADYLGEYSKLIIYVVTEGSLAILLLEIAVPLVVVWLFFRTRARKLASPSDISSAVRGSNGSSATANGSR